MFGTSEQNVSSHSIPTACALYSVVSLAVQQVAARTCLKRKDRYHPVTYRVLERLLTRSFLLTKSQAYPPAYIAVLACFQLYREFPRRSLAVIVCISRAPCVRCVVDFCHLSSLYISMMPRVVECDYAIQTIDCFWNTLRVIYIKRTFYLEKTLGICSCRRPKLQFWYTSPLNHQNWLKFDKKYIDKRDVCYCKWGDGIDTNITD